MTESIIGTNILFNVWHNTPPIIDQYIGVIKDKIISSGPQGQTIHKYLVCINSKVLENNGQSIKHEPTENASVIILPDNIVKFL